MHFCVVLQLTVPKLKLLKILFFRFSKKTFTIKLKPNMKLHWNFSEKGFAFGACLVLIVLSVMKCQMYIFRMVCFNIIIHYCTSGMKK